MDQFLQTNKSSWDQRTEIHKDSSFYDVEGFMSGKTSLNAIELNALGDVRGKSLLHLQCHFGQDTLSWARLGAKVTGADFSPKAVALARSLNDQLGMEATFVESNVLELDKNLQGQFDIVFTSYGVVGWLPSLDEWARVISHFLKPGGIFYFVDFHPTLHLFDHAKMELAYDYFYQTKPLEEETTGTYTDREAPISHKEYYWIHSLHQTIQPLLNHGLHLLEMEEFDYSPYNCFENMEERAPGEFVLKIPHSFPHLFSLKMGK